MDRSEGRGFGYGRDTSMPQHATSRRTTDEGANLVQYDASSMSHNHNNFRQKLSHKHRRSSSSSSSSSSPEKTAYQDVSAAKSNGSSSRDQRQSKRSSGNRDTPGNYGQEQEEHQMKMKIPPCQEVSIQSSSQDRQASWRSYNAQFPLSSSSSSSGPQTTSSAASKGSSVHGSENSAQALQAMAIARRFDRESQQLKNNRGASHCYPHGHGNTGHDHHGRKLDPTPAEYRQRRMVFSEHFEHRKRQALLRNLEYVARKQIERTRERIAQLEETRVYEREMTSRHEAIMRSRSSLMKVLPTTSHAGRQHVEPKRRQHIPKPSDNSVAIYVAGISTIEDQNVTTSTEDMMQSLFGCYGKLQKIHFYVNKQTGKRKGDALVIYHLESDHIEAQNALIESVCSQLNGAELPCGSILQVEPSDPMYKIRRQIQKSGPNNNRNRQDAGNGNESSTSSSCSSGGGKTSAPASSSGGSSDPASSGSSGDGGDSGSSGDGGSSGEGGSSKDGEDYGSSGETSEGGSPSPEDEQDKASRSGSNETTQDADVDDLDDFFSSLA